MSLFERDSHIAASILAEMIERRGWSYTDGWGLFVKRDGTTELQFREAGLTLVSVPVSSEQEDLLERWRKAMDAQAPVEGP